ncbi:MAG TPA: hypothetical protein VK638_11400, partial [Edaphobacter sp.]|nr:hypothetical protein [Edaphobacter sp.]
EFAASSSSMLSQWSLQSAARTGRVLSAAEETLKMVLLRYTAQRFSPKCISLIGQVRKFKSCRRKTWTSVNPVI